MHSPIVVSSLGTSVDEKQGLIILWNYVYIEMEFPRDESSQRDFFFFYTRKHSVCRSLHIKGVSHDILLLYSTNI